jgi:hypothetical protein
LISLPRSDGHRLELVGEVLKLDLGTELGVVLGECAGVLLVLAELGEEVVKRGVELVGLLALAPAPRPCWVRRL